MTINGTMKRTLFSVCFLGIEERRFCSFKLTKWLEKVERINFLVSGDKLFKSSLSNYHKIKRRKYQIL